jgi:hypothetical protein
VKDIEKACPNATIKQAIDIKFNGSDLSTAISEIKNWIDKIK